MGIENRFYLRTEFAPTYQNKHVLFFTHFGYRSSLRPVCNVRCVMTSQSSDKMERKKLIENGECQEEEDGTESCSTSERRTPFTLAALGGKFNEEKVNECHRAVTKFVVKGLHPFLLDMVRTFDSRYKPPSRDSLANRLIPAWYQVERDNLMSALREVSTVAITADGWTSLVQDHYLTVTLHFAVYECQTGDAVAEEIESILNEFGVRSKVVAATVDNAANMDVALRKLRIRKIGCFAHTLNLAAQKINRGNTISNWAARVRSIVVWIKRCHMAKVVLREKQQLLNLPPHALIMDVKTRWNSLYLMVERFYEQFPAIQAEFIDLMSVLYTSTLCVSSENKPNIGMDFLEEATVMDPRFKLKMNSNMVIWDRLKMAAIVEDTEKRFEEDIEDDDQSVEVSKKIEPSRKEIHHHLINVTEKRPWKSYVPGHTSNLSVCRPNVMVVAEEGHNASFGTSGREIFVCSGFLYSLRASVLHSWRHHQ
ncbi:hypothetical protein WMY93_022304 [Mugilogobius chulae]|uniref:Zinc finger BED domain-containing protein 1-like n=1 Tax=Mugilogobius chulae TaxID=88201 RepID=A0AAW0NB41_9GOBI